MPIAALLKVLLCETSVSVCYLVYESVGQMEESHHSTPVDAISKDAPGHLHEDVLSTVGLNLVDQSDRKKWTDSNVTCLDLISLIVKFL